MQTNAILLYYNALTFVCYIPLLVALIVFYRFTGLSYADVKKLSYDDIHTDDRGDMWIIDNRAKTGTQFRVKLLPVAKSLVKRYSHLRLSDNRVFPVKDGNSMNMSLRHVARHAGLSFNPTMHQRRHSFATRCIESKCDYKTVSVLLGHSNISTTLNLYVHPNMEQKRHCIDQMCRMLR